MSDNVHEKNKGIRTVVRTEVFIIVLIAFLVYLMGVMNLHDEEHSKEVFNTYYSEEPGTLDGVYMGSSAAYRYFISPLAYHETGMTVFNLSTSSQPYVMQKYLLQEVLRTQPNTRFVILELRNIVRDPSALSTEAVRKVADSMKLLSPYRVPAIDHSLDFIEQVNGQKITNRMEYYFSFALYHNRWKEDLELEDWYSMDEKVPYKGFLLTDKSYETKKVKDPATYETRLPISEHHQRELEDLLHYCNSLEHTKVIFVFSPIWTIEERTAMMNQVSDYIEQQGFTVWNFNDPTKRYMKEVGLDTDTDFYEANHVNLKGATKFTRYVDTLIQKEVRNLPDHRGDSDYASWEKAFQGMKKDVARNGQELFEGEKWE